MKAAWPALTAVLLTGALAACAAPAPSAAPPVVPSAASGPSITPGPAVSPVVPTDYADNANWLALPESTDRPVDVFYLYPTAWSKTSPSDPTVNTIDNASMRQQAPLSITMQASALLPVGNLYAPFYRQSAAADTLSLPLDQQEQIESGAPKQDAFAAFDYYIAHYNGGRPFILLSHSQGSNVMTFLLSEYMAAHPDVYARMVAAYVVGYGIVQDYLDANPHLRFAEGSADTGVIVSWNTESPSFNGTNPVVAQMPAIAINPITWTRGTTTAGASDSLGSYMPDSSQQFVKVTDYADATVDAQRGVVKCGTVNEQAMLSPSGVFPLGVYHPYDINLYYFDLQANAELRVDAFLAARR
jgi:hypothetical protein